MTKNTNLLEDKMRREEGERGPHLSLVFRTRLTNDNASGSRGSEKIDGGGEPGARDGSPTIQLYKGLRSPETMIAGSHYPHHHRHRRHRRRQRQPRPGRPGHSCVSSCAREAAAAAVPWPRRWRGRSWPAGRSRRDPGCSPTGRDRNISISG